MEEFVKQFPTASQAKKRNSCVARSEKNKIMRIPNCGLRNLSRLHTSYSILFNRARFCQKWEFTEFLESYKYFSELILYFWNDNVLYHQ